MIDISSIGQDMNIADGQAARAKNILQTQLGSLQYAKNLGIDLAYFLSEDFSFQDKSFRSYLVQRLAAYSINVAEISRMSFALNDSYTFYITPDETDSSLISR